MDWRVEVKFYCLHFCLHCGKGENFPMEAFYFSYGSGKTNGRANNSGKVQAKCRQGEGGARCNLLNIKYLSRKSVGCGVMGGEN